MSTTTRSPSALVLDPPGAAWRGLIDQSWRHASADTDSNRLRNQLGLSVDAPVIMSGHQPGFWHPGVLAKRIALREACDALGCSGAWVVVDQDEVDVGLVRAPERGADATLRVREVRLCDAPTPGTPVCAMSAFDPPPEVSWSPEVNTIESVSAGLRSIVAALREHRAASNAAMQVEHGAAGLARPFAGDVHTFAATALSRTDAFGALVERMRADPQGCVAAHNDALERTPCAGVAPLVRDARRDRWELPLWAIEGGLRRRVWSDEVGRLDRETLAPRALTMTLLLRGGACDVFVHGTGGYVYDRATEHWAREWLGRELAPMTCVSATVLLPLRDGDDVVVGARDVAGAAWLAHHARHNPGAIGDRAFDAKKRSVLLKIERAKRDHGDAAGAYRALHALLAEHRAMNAAALRGLDERAESTRRRARESAIANDRMYAFPLHGREALERLRERIRAEFRERVHANETP